jgi:hypothetical protein
MKLVFNLANKTQAMVGLLIDAEEFLQLENISRLAFRVPVEECLITLGRRSPVIPNLAGLLRDYGRSTSVQEGLTGRLEARLFEELLKALLEAVVRSKSV